MLFSMKTEEGDNLRQASSFKLLHHYIKGIVACDNAYRLIYLVNAEPAIF